MSDNILEHNRDNKAYRLIVHGRVQGVGFRHYTRIAALRIGVTGWVRNNYDGTVEVWGEGPQNSLQSLLREVQHGPSRSDVTRVEVAWFAPKNTFRGFTTKS